MDLLEDRSRAGDDSGDGPNRRGGGGQRHRVRGPLVEQRVDHDEDKNERSYRREKIKKDEEESRETYTMLSKK